MIESWPEVREIRIFVAAYEERSFTAAAMREHATQSGVSQHIRRLEERLGTKLFIRRDGMEPTPEGTIYYERCLVILGQYARASDALDGFANSLAGEAAAGVSPWIAVSQLAPAYVQFTCAHPNALLRIVEADSDRLVERVLSGELDFAVILGTPATDERLNTSLFALAPAVLVSSLDSGLVHGLPLRLASLENLELVLPGSGGAVSAIESYLAAQQLDFRRLRLDAIFGMYDLVRRTGWKAIVPCLVMEEALEAPEGDREFTVNLLDAPPLMLELHLVRLAERRLSPVASAFLDELREATASSLASVTQHLDHGPAPAAGPRILIGRSVPEWSAASRRRSSDG